ncbi:hypothetical protein THAOC_00574 [Thalassiosira oceanica]|uniref:Uncharacterized protein n=1 Tax=Thalassiosira oceanica TaxID=159749 RepID=K0TP23_THAOC|nr:hypothetical protein THAOC_00574 [Thalassiosira oceanica]|eukprot:EJK77586.1 hypothetical protein THAOC_00574 [Thalassiosira oceanica]
MLDVLSSGGVTNGQALAQGPYLKIRWAVGVSRGRWDRRRGVEEALWRRRWRRWDVDPLSFRPQGGYRKFCSGNASPGGFVMRCPNRFPGNPQWSADDPTPYCSSGWIICSLSNKIKGQLSFLPASLPFLYLSGSRLSPLHGFPKISNQTPEIARLAGPA